MHILAQNLKKSNAFSFFGKKIGVLPKKPQKLPYNKLQLLTIGDRIITTPCEGMIVLAEYWDVFDQDRRLMGKTHKRGAPLKAGEFHLVVDIVVINTDGRLLIDRRSPKKRNCPNYWEFTSGSVLAGEQSRQGAVRELQEELGLTVEPDQLVLLGSSMLDHRLVDTYMLITEVDTLRLSLQQEEVAEAKLVTLQQLDEVCRTGHTWCRTTLKNYRGIIESTVDRLKKGRPCTPTTSVI